ncbi:MAG: M15 family metallopeptidase [Pseudomonadota bacterium]
MENRVIPAIIGIIVLILVVVGVLIFLQLRPPSDTAEFDDSPLFDEMEGPAIDSGARIEIEKLRRQIEAMTTQMEALDDRINGLQAALDAANAAPIQPADPFAPLPDQGPNEIIDAYAQVVLIANRREVNGDLRIASPSYLTSVFGLPRQDLSDNCQSMTNERLRSKLRLEQVGPVRVQMLEPAIESLRRVFEKIEQTDPDLYARINTAGALCVRRIRGSTRVSTHAFGLSLDLNIDGKLDTLGDGKTQLGLTILADFFRNEGWYWGASFGREDSMHFEVSRDLVEKWIEEGKL